MRHVHKIDTSVERFSLFRSEEAVRECDVAVLVMDAEIGPTTQDKFIASMIQREAKACIILVNKWDLARAKGYTETAAIAHMREMLPYLRHVPVVFMSAQDGYNVRNSIEAIDRVAEHQRRVLPTGVLNRTLSAAMERTQMPSKNGRQLRFHYATQTGANPMILRLFVNDARLATKPFQDFLIRNIREAFDLEGAAIILQFRSRVKSSGKSGSSDAEEETTSEDTLPDGSPRRPLQKPRRAPSKSGSNARRKGPPSLGRGKNNLTPKSRRPRR
jgi:GTP-binding protein